VWGAKTPIGSPIWVSGHAWDDAWAMLLAVVYSLLRLFLDLLLVHGHSEVDPHGQEVSATSIWGIPPRHRVPLAPRRAGLSWQPFLRAQAGAVLGCNFFIVDTVWLKQLYARFTST
jgi:hypothetical protein